METSMSLHAGQKHRILFVLPSLMPGGAERVMITLMNDLDRDQFTPALAAVYPGGALQDLVSDNIPVWDLNHQGHILSSMMKILKLIRREKIDIVVSTMAPMNFTVLMLKPFLGKTKIIVREATVLPVPNAPTSDAGCTMALSQPVPAGQPHYQPFAADYARICR
jgi:hypothetical protein